jgi:hypothetical protein
MRRSRRWRMFHMGETVGMYRKSDADTVPIGQGVLTAMSPQYEVRAIRWRTPGVPRSRLYGNTASLVALPGDALVRPAYHARDAKLLATWFPA